MLIFSTIFNQNEKVLVPMLKVENTLQNYEQMK